MTKAFVRDKRVSTTYGGKGLGEQKKTFSLVKLQSPIFALDK